ncbi:MAG: ADP-ribosylglycohydrolase family protein [Halomonas sp.]|nr:ADP-ribosylglycohydrolase family protein [Halomonas sp.]
MTPKVTHRASAALKNLFIGDALAMPVHWFYNAHDIDRAFPEGITTFEAPPAFHPSSIMSMHSTRGGGRKRSGSPQPEIVGDVILKGKQGYWNRPNIHYHQGMQPGDNTLNAHCALTLMNSMTAPDQHYDSDTFLKAYIELMTAETPAHPDTYAESYHRGFFANLKKGLPPKQCGAVTHDTPSIGGLVTIAPLAIGERLKGTSLADTRNICRQHLALTHPDTFLADICDAYVELIDNLLFRDNDDQVEETLLKASRSLAKRELTQLVKSEYTEREVIGGVLSTACYITDAWPAVLYLACKHHDNPMKALQINAEVGGDNVHRGAVLGVLLGLINAEAADEDLFARLTEQASINRAIECLMG